MPAYHSTKSNSLFYLLLIIALVSFSSCLTSKKLERFVSEQYNNELPKPTKKKKADIVVTSTMNGDAGPIATSVHKKEKFLPLLFYWKYHHRYDCALNTSIPVINFSNAVQSVATKALADKLNGRKLELTVEQAPAAFSIVIRENMVWIIYAVSWAKVYIEPEGKDLIVSYKLTDGASTVKTGTITIENTAKKKGFRYFQSWKSATSEYITDYNASVINMAKAFVADLLVEL